MKIVVVGDSGRIGAKLVTVLVRDGHEVILDPHARHFGAELNERSLVPGDEAELGEIRFDEWLGRTVAPISDRRRQLASGGDVGSVDVSLVQAVQGA